MKKSIKNLNDLTQIAKKIAPELKEGTVLFLEGDLGAGKTTFVRCLGEALKSKTPITSPTFTIIQKYNALIPIVHIDLYRIEKESDIYFLDLPDLLDTNDQLICIEWPERLGKYTPKDYIKISLSYPKSTEVDESQRELEIQVLGEKYQSCFQNIKSKLSLKN